MAGPTPFLVYGDGPRLPSGLGRIARDLLIRLAADADALGIQVMQFGVDPPDGWHWNAWPFWGLQPHLGDQGHEALEQILQQEIDPDGPAPIVLMIMDPSRCYDLTSTFPQGAQAIEDGARRVRFWGYFPIDSENIEGRIGGPAADAIGACERVLAYGRYGARVLASTLQAQIDARVGGRGRAAIPAVAYLPHGLDSGFQPAMALEESGLGFVKWRAGLPGDAWILGCVATNQPRKDLSLLFATASLLKREGARVGVWLHTDRQTNAWDVGQLCRDFGLARLEVCLSTAETVLTDRQLAARYCASDVTLGVGLGEGFGYPLVESLACGTPVIHGRFAGGVELIPHPAWLVDPVAWRLESCYAVKRPVLNPPDVAGAAALAIGWKRAQPAVCAAYCHGAVSYLQWDAIWPRWRAWVRRGLQEPPRWDTRVVGTRLMRGAGRPK